MKEDLEGNIEEMKKYLKKLDESGLYDAEKYSRSLLHQTSQLSYFYCSLVRMVHHRILIITSISVQKNIRWLILISVGDFLRNSWMGIGVML